MKVSDVTPGGNGLSESQRSALLTLLTDDDAAVYQTVRERILSYGAAAAAWLRPHTLSADPLLRRRVQEILDHMARQAADARFLAFCVRRGEDFDLEQATWLLATSGYPDINVEAYEALLDSFADKARAKAGSGLSAEDTLVPLNVCLYAELGFQAIAADPYDPEDCYLNRVIDRRVGNPLSLGLIFLFVSRRLGLPVTGIGLPGYFLCRFQSSTEEVFIDTFQGGRFLTKADCIHYLRQSGHESAENLLVPASPRRLLRRLCSMLHQIYLHLKLRDETARLQRYVVALAR